MQRLCGWPAAFIQLLIITVRHGHPVPLTSLGVEGGPGFDYENLKGRLLGAFGKDASSLRKESEGWSWPPVSSDWGACSWGALVAGLGRKPVPRTSLPAAALLTWKINFLFSQACVSWCLAICSPRNIKTDTFISWCDFEYLFQCYIHPCLVYLIINLIWKPFLWLWIDLICIYFSCLIFVCILLISCMRHEFTTILWRTLTRELSGFGRQMDLETPGLILPCRLAKQ